MTYDPVSGHGTVTVYTNDPNDAGIYEVQLRSWYNTMPNDISIDLLQIPVVIDANQCAFVKFSSHSLQTITFMIESSATPATYQFPQFTIVQGSLSCGAISYSLYDAHHTVSLQASIRTLSVFTTDIADIGTHTMNWLFVF